MAALRQLGAQAARAMRSGNAIASSSKSAMGVARLPVQHWTASPQPFVAVAPFSSSSAVSAPKKAARKAPVKRKTALKKKATPTKAKRRGGDAGATLSRTNPFMGQRKDMSQLPELLPEYGTEANVNNVYALSQKTLDAIKYPGGFGLPSSLSRHFASMPRPRTLLRPQSLSVFAELDKAAASDEGAAPVNAVLHAPVGSGMSTLLLQAFSYALESGWIVLMISRGHMLVDSSTPYVYSDAQKTYLQPELAADILQQLLTVNGAALRQVKVTEATTELPGSTSSIKQGDSLADVAKLGTQRGLAPEAAQTVLEVVLRTLVRQRDVPVLFAVDGLQGLYSTSLYRDPDYRALESYELAVPRALQACLRTTGPGAYGGIQRGMSLSTVNQHIAEWPVPRELAMAHPSIAPHLVEPYAKLNDTTLQIVQDCKMRILDYTHTSQLTHIEAGALFDIARKEGGLWSVANDEFLMSKLVESGGSMATFERSLRQSML